MKVPQYITSQWFLRSFVIQSLNHFWLLATPQTAAHQASLSFTISWSLLKLMSIESVMPSPPLWPPSHALHLSASGAFLLSSLFTSGDQSIGASASASVLPMNIHDWFPLGLTSWLSLQSKGLKSLLQNHTSKASILWYSAFFMVQLSHPYMTMGKTITLTRWTFAK